MTTLVFDVETSGLPFNFNSKFFVLDDYENARLIELGYMVLDEAGTVLKSKEFLINDTVNELSNTHIHGITLDDLKDRGVPTETAFEEFYQDLQHVQVLVAHNIRFDTNIMLSECQRNLTQFRTLKNTIRSKPLFCTMLHGKEVMKVRKWPKLLELYEHLTSKQIVQTHRALDDVKLCAECYQIMKPFVICNNNNVS